MGRGGGEHRGTEMAKRATPGLEKHRRATWRLTHVNGSVISRGFIVRSARRWRRRSLLKHMRQGAGGRRSCRGPYSAAPKNRRVAGCSFSGCSRSPTHRVTPWDFPAVVSPPPLRYVATRLLAPRCARPCVCPVSTASPQTERSCRLLWNVILALWISPQDFRPAGSGEDAGGAGCRSGWDLPLGEHHGRTYAKACEVGRRRSVGGTLPKLQTRVRIGLTIHRCEPTAFGGPYRARQYASVGLRGEGALSDSLGALDQGRRARVDPHRHRPCVCHGLGRGEINAPACWRRRGASGSLHPPPRGHSLPVLCSAR